MTKKKRKFNKVELNFYLNLIKGTKNDIRVILLPCRTQLMGSPHKYAGLQERIKTEKAQFVPFQL